MNNNDESADITENNEDEIYIYDNEMTGIDENGRII